MIHISPNKSSRGRTIFIGLDAREWREGEKAKLTFRFRRQLHILQQKPPEDGALWHSQTVLLQEASLLEKIKMILCSKFVKTSKINNVSCSKKSLIIIFSF